MRLAMIGSGRMGDNIARRLMRGGREIVSSDNNAEAVAALVADGATAAFSLQSLCAKRDSPRIFWVMLPAGPTTEETIYALTGAAEKGDIIIDGGNGFCKDDIRGARACKEKGIHHVDVGTSGGVWGLECGFCMMIGWGTGNDPVTRSDLRHARARFRRNRAVQGA